MTSESPLLAVFQLTLNIDRSEDAQALITLHWQYYIPTTIDTEAFTSEGNGKPLLQFTPLPSISHSFEFPS
jgi:hypothetical protein